MWPTKTEKQKKNWAITKNQNTTNREKENKKKKDDDVSKKKKLRDEFNMGFFWLTFFNIAFWILNSFRHCISEWEEGAL